MQYNYAWRLFGCVDVIACQGEQISLLKSSVSLVILCYDSNYDSTCV